jgi:predicted Holliday junction resolvase-like endonuclease
MPLSAMPERCDGYTSGDTWPVKVLINTKSREFRRNSMRRDGRVVDGGGLESINAHFAEFAFFRLKSARHAR